MVVRGSAKRRASGEARDGYREGDANSNQPRDDVRAKLRSTIKRLLARYGYPPDAQPTATELVLRQMETFAEEWSPTSSF